MLTYFKSTCRIRIWRTRAPSLPTFGIELTRIVQGYSRICRKAGRQEGGRVMSIHDILKSASKEDPNLCA